MPPPHRYANEQMGWAGLGKGRGTNAHLRREPAPTLCVVTIQKARPSGVTLAVLFCFILRKSIFLCETSEFLKVDFKF